MAAHPASGDVSTLASRHGATLRALWFTLACACLALAAVGVVIPGLPTTPFLIVAAIAASRSSPRLHRWLTEHRVFGQMIRDWNDERAVGRSAKWAATATMFASGGVLLALTGARWPAVLAIGVMALVGGWLWRRPEPG